MDRVVEICERRGMTLVEDCAHTCGVKWRGRQLGYHGKVGYKIARTRSAKVILTYMIYYVLLRGIRIDRSPIVFCNLPILLK